MEFSRQEHWSGLPRLPPGDFEAQGLKPRSPTLQADSLLSESPGKPNTGVACQALLQGIFSTQGSNPGLLHCRWILYHLSHQASPWIPEWVPCLPSRGSYQPGNKTRACCIAGGYFTSWAIREASNSLEEALPCPPPGDLPNPGIKSVSLMSPALGGRFFTTITTWEDLDTILGVLTTSFHLFFKAFLKAGNSLPIFIPYKIELRR